ncbi:MAG: hypothetical protein WDA06_15780, partial [Phenylobacterium sp.]
MAYYLDTYKGFKIVKPEPLASGGQSLNDNFKATANHVDATTSIHGSTSANTANRIVQRDASGNINITSLTSTRVFANAGPGTFSITNNGINFGYANTFLISFLNTGKGSIVGGYGRSQWNNTVEATGNSSFAMGHVSYNSDVRASGDGSLAFGYAQEASSITASGEGSLALGDSRGGSITALGDGSFALGNSDWGGIQALGD